MVADLAGRVDRRRSCTAVETKLVDSFAAEREKQMRESFAADLATTGSVLES